MKAASPPESRRSSHVLVDRDAHQVAPFRPRAIVVADVLVAQQVGEHEPRVARPLADAAVGDHVAVRFEAGPALVQGFQFIGGLEGAVGGHGLSPRDVGGAGDVAAAQGALLRIIRHVGEFAAVLGR